jgi:hypothetical protein
MLARPLAVVAAACLTVACGDAAVPLPGGATGPAPTTLVAGQISPRAVTADDDGVYWANGDGTVMMLELGKQEPRTLAEGQGEVVAIAVDKHRIFWIVGGDVGALRNIGKTGTGDPFETVSGLVSPHGIALDENCVYWVTDDAVMTIWKDGGELITVAADRTAPADVEVDTTGTYWVDGNDGGAVWRVLMIGQPPEKVAATSAAPLRLALADGNVVWTETGGTVMRAPVEGGAAQVVAASEAAPSAVAAAGGEAFWVAAGGSSVRGAALAGGSVTTIAADQAQAADLAASADALYWVNAGDGSVVSVPR